MEKIKNFFYYNWIKIAAIIFVLVFALVTFRQCERREEIDLGVMYAGKSSSASLPKLTEIIKSDADLADTDGDGVLTVNAKSIIIPDSRDLMMEQQIPEQIQVEVISGDNRVYVFGKDTLISYSVDENLADITSLAQKYEYDTKSCLAYPDGRIYAIGLDGNLLFKELGLNSEGMFVAVRNYLEKDADDPKNINAIKAAEYIIK